MDRIVESNLEQRPRVMSGTIAKLTLLIVNIIQEQHINNGKDYYKLRLKLLDVT